MKQERQGFIQRVRSGIEKHKKGIAIATAISTLPLLGGCAKEEQKPQANITATVTTGEASGNGGTVPTTEGGIVVTETTTTTKAPETTTTTEALDKGETVLMETDQIKISKYEELSNLPNEIVGKVNEKTSTTITDVLGINLREEGKKLGDKFYIVKAEDDMMICYKKDGECFVDTYIAGACIGNPHLKTIFFTTNLESKNKILIYELGGVFSKSGSDKTNDIYITRIGSIIKPIYNSEDRIKKIVFNQVELIRIIHPSVNEIIEIKDNEVIKSVVDILNPAYDIVNLEPIIEQKYPL